MLFCRRSMGPFVHYFWIEFLNLLCTFEGIPRRVWSLVKLSTAFHPQMDGQAEHTIQTLEDLLRACVIDFKGNWDDH